MQQFISYFENAFILTITQLIYTFGLSIAIAIAMSAISRFIYKHLWQEYGSKGVSVLIYATAIGTVIHELSHALFCIIFNHKVTGISLFHPTGDGTLGYVEHEYDKNNRYQSAGNFFIGIAPIIAAGAATYLLAMWLVPNLILPNIQAHNIGSILQIVAQIYHNLFIAGNLTNWHFWLFIILVFAISGHATLSGADMKGAASGIIALILLVFLINCMTIWIPNVVRIELDFLIRYYAVFYASMLFGLSVYVGLMGVLLGV